MPVTPTLQVTPADASAQPAAPHTMRCLEVWGGNQAVDNGVVMAGLDAWLYSRPYRGHAAGGDIHYVSSCAAGMLTRILVADVSGHGQAVAGAADTLRGLMRRYVNFVDQTELVRSLNVEFSALSQSGGFATAVVASYLTHTDEFTLCNAGHPRPLWYRARSREWAVMSNPGGGPGAGPGSRAAARPDDQLSNVPLGISGPACYDQTRTRLGTGDLVVFYTDSLIEARAPDGRLLGEDGLLSLARTLDPSDPSEFIHALLRRVSAHTGVETGPIAADDLTILILRPNGLKPRVPSWVVAKYLARMTAHALRSLLPGGPPFPWTDAGLMGKAGRALNRLNPRWGVARAATQLER
ncbi:MAG: PP2C family protein-serine/threonine phosphatase [Phycisphaerales bacterium]